MKEVLTVLRNRNLALLLSGRIVSVGGDWLYVIALSIAIFRYSHHSSFLIGLFWLVRLVPNLFLGPVGGTLADRLGDRPAMMAADLGRMVLVAAMALVLRPSTWPVIYPLAFLVTSLSNVFRPANVALVRSLVRSPQERIAANAVVGEIDNVAMIVGSALGGIVGALGLINQLLLFDAASFGISALSLWFIQLPRKVEAAPAAAEEPEEEDVGGGVLAGFRLVRHRPLLLFAAAVMAFPEFVSGAVVVWIVPYAITQLHLGNAGVGYLYSAYGVGSLLGGVLVAMIAANVRLDALLAGSVAVGGVATAFFGLWPIAVAALCAVALLGVSEMVEATAEQTLVQQAAPENVLARTAGTMDSFFYNMMLAGNLLSGLLAGSLGLRTSMMALGSLSVLVTGGAWWLLRVRTAHQPEAATLARIPAFAHVPLAVREWAVRRMEREEFPPGAVIIWQGDEGDKFYAIARGTVQVEVQSDGRVLSTELGPGDFFGEIALLQNVPRTATIRALQPLTVYALSREDFQELQSRAGELKDSLLEIANARMEEDRAFSLSVAGRGV